MEDSFTETEKLVVFTSKEEKEEEVNVVEEKPIGFINQLISNFAPGEKEDGEKEKKRCVESEEQEKDEGKDKGLFSHIISNLVSPVSSPRVRDGKASEFFRGGEEEKITKAPEKDGGNDGSGGGSGGGIIDNIVSNLTSPLPDNAAPATDEASVLIHSIIHD